MRRRLRLRTLKPWRFSNSSKKATIKGASTSSNVRREGGLRNRCWMNFRNWRKVSR